MTKVLLAYEGSDGAKKALDAAADLGGDPGTYTVRCFEYCGVGHHRMFATFRVEDSS